MNRSVHAAALLLPGCRRGEDFAARDWLSPNHVEHFEQPRAHLRQMSADEKVQSLRDGVVEFNKAKVLREETVSLDGHPGREITIERPDDITLRKRLFAVHDRMHVLYTKSAPTLIPPPGKVMPPPSALATSSPLLYIPARCPEPYQTGWPLP